MKPSGNWRKFGFPVFYVTDNLQVAEAMIAHGLANDARLANTIRNSSAKTGCKGTLAVGIRLHRKNLGGFWTKETGQ